MRSIYPQHDLRTVIKYISTKPDQINDKRQFKREELSVFLGFAPASGMAQTIISSMVHYGLLDNFNGHYRFSSAAKDLASSQTPSQKRDEIMNTLLTTPLIFRYIDGRLGLVNPHELAAKFGIATDKAQKVMSNYKLSARYAHSNSYAMTTPPQNDDAPSSSSELPPKSNPSKQGVVTVTLENGSIIKISKEVLAEALQSRVNELDRIRQQILNS